MKITIKLLPTSVVCDDPSFNEWSEAVNNSIMKRVRAPWIIGDLMNYGELKFGPTSWQVLDECIVQYHTLENWRWVCRQYEPSRRRESLSWSHHETVARMPDKQQDEWLDIAERKRLSVHDLRYAVKGKMAQDILRVDEKYVHDFKQWVDETVERTALLNAIKRGTVEVVGFDKDKQTPLVKRKSEAAYVSF